MTHRRLVSSKGHALQHKAVHHFPGHPLRFRSKFAAVAFEFVHGNCLLFRSLLEEVIVLPMQFLPALPLLLVALPSLSMPSKML